MRVGLQTVIYVLLSSLDDFPVDERKLGKVLRKANGLTFLGFFVMSSIHCVCVCVCVCVCACVCLCLFPVVMKKRSRQDLKKKKLVLCFLRSKCA